MSKTIMRHTFIPIGVLLLAVVLQPIGSAEAGEIKTLTYQSGDILHQAGNFILPADHTYGVFQFPQFDPSLGYLMQIKGTATIVEAQWSRVQADNEESIYYGGQAYGEGFWAGGYLRTGLSDNPMENTVIEIWGGKVFPVILQADNEPDDGDADFAGTDWYSYSAGPTYNVSDSAIATLVVPIEHAQDDPYIGHYVGTGDVNVDYVVESCIIAYVARCEKIYTFGDVTVSATIEYTYEVPEPATLGLLLLGGLTLLRRRRK